MTLYLWVSGRVPFEATTVMLLMDAIKAAPEVILTVAVALALALALALTLTLLMDAIKAAPEVAQSRRAAVGRAHAPHARLVPVGASLHVTRARCALQRLPRPGGAPRL